MKYSLFIIFIFCLCLGSCSENDKAEDVLSEEQMSSLLLDIYEAESGLAELRLNRDTTIEIFKAYESFLFENHQIDKEVYKKSLTYYYDHPEALEEVYDMIIDSLTLRESKIKAIEESERQKRDSISKATREKLMMEDSLAKDSIKRLKPTSLDK